MGKRSFPRDPGAPQFLRAMEEWHEKEGYQSKGRKARKALFKEIHLQPNLLNVAMSPVYLVVPNPPYTFSLDEYLPETNKGEGYPWRLIDSVDDKGWVTLKVNLNQTKARDS